MLHCKTHWAAWRTRKSRYRQKSCYSWTLRALESRVLSVRWTLISENAKSIPMLAAKARYRRCRRDCILWNQSASRPGLQICLVSRKTRRYRRKRRRRKRWYAAQSFRRYIVVGYSFNAAPNGLHTSYGQRKMTNILYSTRKNSHLSFFRLHFVRWVPEKDMDHIPYWERRHTWMKNTIKDGSSCLITFLINMEQDTKQKQIEYVEKIIH